MMAVKAGVAASTIWLAERMWKKRQPRRRDRDDADCQQRHRGGGRQQLQGRVEPPVSARYERRTSTSQDGPPASGVAGPILDLVSPDRRSRRGRRGRPRPFFGATIGGVPAVRQSVQKRADPVPPARRPAAARVLSRAWRVGRRQPRAAAAGPGGRPTGPGPGAGPPARSTRIGNRQLDARQRAKRAGRAGRDTARGVLLPLVRPARDDAGRAGSWPRPSSRGWAATALEALSATPTAIPVTTTAASRPCRCWPLARSPGSRRCWPVRSTTATPRLSAPASRCWRGCPTTSRPPALIDALKQAEVHAVAHRDVSRSLRAADRRRAAAAAAPPRSRTSATGARRCCRGIRWTGSIDDLAALAADPAPLVRKAAVASLAQIGGPASGAGRARPAGR